MAAKRPKLIIPPEKFDKILEVAAVVLLFVLWVYTFAVWSVLPETIPVHFNVKGQADGFGDRITIFFGPLLSLVLYFLLTVLNRRPDIFNYPVKITPENAQFHYRLAMRLMRMLKLSLVLMFGVITWSMAHAARTGDSRIISLSLPFVLAITFLPMVYYFTKIIRDNPKSAPTTQTKTKPRKFKLY
ncbi:MAG TPA: DUF1648 domain-containing protein [Bacteroidales bacterium]|nr:DUF1648 domain-containing protein [Bacteroidales bacterium]